MKTRRLNNKGYAMTEALIVSAVVLTALLLIYLQFTKLNSAYGEQYYYNNVNGIYSLNQIATYIASEDNTNLISDLATYVDITSCNSRYFTNEKYCKMIMSASNVDYIFFTFNNKNTLLSALKANNPYDMRLQNFIKTITTSGSAEHMLVAKFKDGYYAAIPYVANGDIEVIGVNTEWKFNYNGTDGTDGTVQVFVAPKTGIYKLETWGASGNTPIAANVSAGYGGYSKGEIKLKKDDVLYIVVGGQGQAAISTAIDGGYNGGGSARDWSDGRGAGSGGGATHIATSTGILSDLESNKSSIIMVSGGGGGVGNYTGKFNSITLSAGSGGGKTGTNGVSENYIGYGGTQENGGAITAGTGTIAQYNGTAGIFGEGGNCSASTGNCSGGGAGYYGGGSNINYSGGAGGGSGYIGNKSLKNKKMVCYNCTEDKDNISTYTETTTCKSDAPTANCAKEGNGYAVITFINAGLEPNTTYNFDYNGSDVLDPSEQIFKPSENGVYQLEVWGAQGGGDLGGQGGYSTGYVYLTTSDILYINVGGQGNGRYGGYNGGGTQTANIAGGGGATHIAKITGTLANLREDLDDILIVAGAGGGEGGEFSRVAGGAGGGIEGNNGVGDSYGSGGTQSSGGTPQNSGGCCSSRIDGSFGAGGSCTWYSEVMGAGGGGYYGGGSAGGGGSNGSGGGGSGYIGNNLLYNKKMVCYNCTTSDDATTKTETTRCEGLNATPECSKLGNGYARITFIGEPDENTIMARGQKYNYTGGEQIFTAENTGVYKIESWGAQGGSSVGNNSDREIGGYGAYSVGEVILYEGDTLYINVGGKGEKGAANYNAQGGYNGGGNATFDNSDDESAGGGGGATSIATATGTLASLSNNKASVLMVAAGGGGSAWYLGPSAGGFKSYASEHSTSNIATQNMGYAFGQGQSAPALVGSTATQSLDGVAGAGGGWYGGYVEDINDKACATGGSSYIGNAKLKNKQMVCYDCDEDNNLNTKTVSTTCYSAKATPNCAKEGNGVVIVTYVGTLEDTAGVSYDYTYNGENGSDGSVQEYTAPAAGYYQLEVWGAQGGAISTTSTEVTGGYGGYSEGRVYLNKNEKIYLTIGGQGEGSTGTTNGGYNGGGYARTGVPSEEVASGGGATHIATELIDNGLLSSYSSSQDKVLIVAGGGGGSFSRAAKTSIGGSGGGFTGVKSSTCDNNGGTQLAGGTKCGSGGNQNGAFGTGGIGQSWSGGAGGGYYGGGGGYGHAGSGGSGYLASSLTNKAMYCYDCIEDLTNASTYTISTTGDNKDSVICPDGYSNDPVSHCAKAGNGAVRITYLGETPVGTSWDFDYLDETNDTRYQVFTAPKAGTYKLEVWGAQGGNDGGEGGYATGTITLTDNENIYVVVGGQASAFNGGGDGSIKGGGATHIAKTNFGELKNYESKISDLLIVAGGGGAKGNFSYNGDPYGGVGGGLSGGNGVSIWSSGNGVGGTQSGGGRAGGTTGGGCSSSSAGEFGVGGIGGSESDSYSGSGGGGFYGGGGGSCRDGGGGGGSSYIDGVTNGSTIDGSDTMPTHDGMSTMTGNTGNGYAKITYIGQ